MNEAALLCIYLFTPSLSCFWILDISLFNLVVPLKLFKCKYCLFCYDLFYHYRYFNNSLFVLLFAINK
jgi:hypothetical protein